MKIKIDKGYAKSRAAEYPSLREFAEAYTEKEMGNEAKWDRYMHRIRSVRAKYPKTKSSSTTSTTE